MKYIKAYETVTEKNERIFTRAIEQNNIKKVKKILDTNIIELNKKTGIERFHVSNVNPLWYAISLGRTEIAEELIKYGADGNVKLSSNCYTILLAAYENNLKILKNLIDNGVDMSVENEYNKDFFDSLSDERQKEFISLYPEQYEKYILEKNARKYNL